MNSFENCSLNLVHFLRVSVHYLILHVMTYCAHSIQKWPCTFVHCCWWPLLLYFFLFFRKNGPYWCHMESLSLTVGLPYIQRCYKQLGDRPFEQKSYGPHTVMAKETFFTRQFCSFCSSRVGRRFDNQKLYCNVLDEMARCGKFTGRAALLTGDMNNMMKVAVSC